ncbi:MAG: hypothetical protein SWH68_06110 [Thermodesulfobacteriota bacterium]|nr:hypothetical protein [Thermodesulfobacteriota bacterium]
MGSKDEQVLRTAKEVVVKFIEIGRISPSTFPESFSKIYDAIYGAVNKSAAASDEVDTPPKNG